MGAGQRRLASARPRIPPAQGETVEERLRKENWSPQQIAGHGEVAISHERIRKLPRQADTSKVEPLAAC